MFRAILFDFNGVLVDDEPLHFEMFQRVLAEEGIVFSAEDYYQKFLGLDDRGCFGAVLAAAGQEVSVPRLMRLIARKARYYQERIRAGGYPFFPGAVELVRSVSAVGCMLGVVSGALQEEVEGALRQAGCFDLFKVIVAAEDVTEGKPDPEGYRKALDVLNSEPPLPARLFHPHEVLAIEDSPAGLSAATDAGLRTLGVAQTYPAGHLALAERVVAAVAGLTFQGIVARFGAP
ncbi:MAG TPA: HAD family phosphatase [Thermoanaerobaculia bacterium]|nr:HAD family phosphatase [Thermoanaerobaculia bacterium]